MIRKTYQCRMCKKDLYTWEIGYHFGRAHLDLLKMVIKKKNYRRPSPSENDVKDFKTESYEDLMHQV